MVNSRVIGNIYNRLTVVDELGQRNGKRFVKAVCSCGNTIEVALGHLKSGHTKSCGCLKAEGNRKTHGMTGTHLYKKRISIRSRCNNVNVNNYKDYGGRGIVCERNSFDEFYRDMGDEYYKHIKKYGIKNTSIDRIDNGGNYNKENCRRATRKIQNNNSRHNRLITYKGKTQNMKQWSEEIGIPYNRLAQRIIQLKRPTEKAFNI